MSDVIRYADFTEENKSNFMAIAEKIIEFSIIARYEGLLAVEEHLEEIAELNLCPKYALFFKKALQLTMDGFDPSDVKIIMENYSYYSSEIPFDSLIFDMILYGALTVQNGDNPRILAEKLVSYVGIVESQPVYERFINKIDGLCSIFEERREAATADN